MTCVLIRRGERHTRECCVKMMKAELLHLQARIVKRQKTDSASEPSEGSNHANILILDS